AAAQAYKALMADNPPFTSASDFTRDPTFSIEAPDHPNTTPPSGGSTPPVGSSPPVTSPLPVVVPPKPTDAPVSEVVGSGPDALVLKISQDAWNGSAQYTIAVDGKAVGGVFTAHADHDSGLHDTITLNGNWGAGAHTVTVQFINDSWGGTADTDRNLYVDAGSYNGVGISGASASLVQNGPAFIAFDATPETLRSSQSVTLPANVLNLRLMGSGNIDGMGNALDNTITGNAGANKISGGGGDDTLNGGAGADTMAGGTGDDAYYVDHSRDVVTEKAGEGSDRVFVSADWTISANLEKVVLRTAVTLRGNGEDNLVHGSNGADHVLGMGGNDRLNGNGGADLLEGGDGNDVLRGGDGNDTLIGGLGADRMFGEAGADVFRFGSLAEKGDVIEGFVSGQDVIEVSAGHFGGGLRAGMLRAGQFTANTTGHASSPAGVGQFTYETDTGRLWWDADGAGGQAGTVLVTLSGHPAFAASDIHLIG
ncbi:calcium-binding protein, partial [Pararoseomonas indoligenes]